MNKFGFSEKDFLLLDKIVLSKLKLHGAKVFLFGSRAKKQFHPFSDVDLVYSCTNPINPVVLSEIKEEIEESLFPYAVEIVWEQDLIQSYKDDILQTRIEI